MGCEICGRPNALCRCLDVLDYLRVLTFTEWRVRYLRRNPTWLSLMPEVLEALYDDRVVALQEGLIQDIIKQS